jgi:hypothetical protein
MERLSLVVCCLLTLGAASQLRAEDDPAKAKHPAAVVRLWARGPSVEELKKDLDLNDEQIAKIKESVDKIKKTFDEKPEVKAAEEELKKADEAHKAAADKVRILREGENVLSEYKKAVLDNVPEDKKIKAAQVVHVKGAGKAAPDKPKTEEKPKTDAPAPDGGGMEK